MKDLKQKIRLIYLPCLLASACVILIYTFLRWLLFIKFHSFNVKEEVLDLWIPFVIPWLVILILLRKKIKLIIPRSAKKNPRFAFQMFLWMSMIAPMLIAQEYIKTATGKLTNIHDVTSLSYETATKYYTIDHYYIDKKDRHTYYSSSVSGKHNEYLDFSAHIVLPICRDSFHLYDEGIAWLGIRYNDQVSNRLSADEKESRFNEFQKNCQHKIISEDLQDFIYLDNTGNNANHDLYNKSIEIGNKYNSSNCLVLLPVKQPFSERNGQKLPWVFGSYAIGSAILLLLLIFVDLDKNADTDKDVKVQDTKDTKEWTQFFLPGKTMFVTPIVIDLNILVFLCMVFAGLGVINFNGNDLLKWGGNFRPLTINDNEWWRLFTNIFLHGGLMHLFSNMYGLIIAGIFLEPVLGRLKYFIVYIVTGILASISSVWWHEATVSVGASGAIFGLYGTLLALLLMRVFPKKSNKQLLVGTLIFILFNLVMGLTGGIDNAAHIGGLVSGFAIGFILYPGVKRIKKEDDDIDTPETKI